jgi:mitogen-activated protein kinase organizer 1
MPSVKLSIPGHGQIHALSYNSNGNYILSGGQDRLIHLWNANSGLKINSYKIHMYEVLDIAVSFDDSKFASCGGDRTAYLWDVSTATTLARFSGHVARINSTAFNSDASVLATASYDTSVKLWDCRSRSHKPIQELTEAKDSVSAVQICGHEIITGSVDGNVRIYDIRKGALATMLMGHSVTSVQRSKDAATLLVSSLDSCIRLMDKEYGTLLQTYKGHANAVYRIKSLFAKNDSLVMSTSEDGKLYIWDFLSGEIIQTLTSRSRPYGQTENTTAFSLAVHPTRGEFATSSLDGTIELWEGL